MKRTFLALALVATTFGAFAQTPVATAKPVVHKAKAHKKAEVKKAEAAKPEVTKPAAVVKVTPAVKHK
ncbi:hypothetical protein PBAL39_06151 [Pedobacter sp. BAL39]|uniref:hypothetical protein n=1 Tax=Pedobacter sp. BAL39 TaxID=391596 RepID=UPI000155974E|nr:hypothetical protein [Pedobacter sp. BAL39]EDM35738.1 hypothetical protein PBAL39_06151 [Pedobacter sp. BAL39]